MAGPPPTCNRPAGSPPGADGTRSGAYPRARQELVDAVEHKRRLRFLYNGKVRLVEPQCYGIGTKGTELLRAHQLRGGREPEPLFDISKISGLEVLDEVFSRPGPNYKRDDSAMSVVFAQL